MPVLMAGAAFGQAKPNFTGTWELVAIERDGSKIQAGKAFKATQIRVHQEPKLSRLVSEQELVNAVPGAPARIIRTCTLDPNGSRIVCDSVHWMAGDDQRFQDKWI